MQSIRLSAEEARSIALSADERKINKALDEMFSQIKRAAYEGSCNTTYSRLVNQGDMQWSFDDWRKLCDALEKLGYKTNLRVVSGEKIAGTEITPSSVKIKITW